MSTFLLLNALPFAPALKAAGHRVIQAAFRPLDSLQGILNALGPDKPDHIVITAMGDSNLPSGLAAAPCPLSLVALDSCLNEFWLKDYARLFDAVFADQPGSVPVLGAAYLPLSVAEDYFLPPQPKLHDLVFVGRCQPHRLKRLHLLEKLRKHFSIHVVGEHGEYVSVRHMLTLFAQSRVTLNENLFPGLTLRPLQAMASGTLLLSESNAVFEAAFRPGLDFVDFDESNLLEKTALALEEARRGHVAAAGREACLTGHTHTVRAAQFLELLPAKRLPLAENEAEYHENAALYALSLRYERPQYRAHSLEKLSRLSHAHAGAALLLAKARWRGHDGPPQLDCKAFLRASSELPPPENWQAALCLGYALARNPAPPLPPRTAFDLARRLALHAATDAQVQNAFDGLFTLFRGPDLTWPLDMALARLCLALGLNFETGFGKPEGEKLPGNAAEFLARILETQDNYEARLLLALCYERCGLVSEAAGQYQHLLPLLEHVPEVRAGALACLRRCYMD